MTRSELKTMLDRYAYQTRHGTDVGAEMVLDELEREVSALDTVRQLEADAKKDAVLQCEAAIRMHQAETEKVSQLRDALAGAVDCICGDTDHQKAILKQSAEILKQSAEGAEDLP